MCVCVRKYNKQVYIMLSLCLMMQVMFLRIIKNSKNKIITITCKKILMTMMTQK